MKKKRLGLIVLFSVIFILIIVAVAIFVNMQNKYANNEKLEAEKIDDESEINTLNLIYSKMANNNPNFILKEDEFARELNKNFGSENYIFEIQNDKYVITFLSSNKSYFVDKYGNIYSKTDNIFEEYYDKAETIMSRMTLEEKVAQMFILGASKNDYSSLTCYKFGGYIFFKPYFSGKSEEQIKNDISDLQDAIKNAGGLPYLMAIDEEGQTVSRLNKTLKVSPNFKNSSEIYNDSGLEGIRLDTINKSNILKNLGLNLNFAPDVDIADEGKYIYERTLKQDAIITSQFAETVIKASKGTGVSYTLKHFPGYGNSVDTHLDYATDNRERIEFNEKDLIPFEKGIEAGAEIIMVTHNIVTCMDDKYPSSISKKVHDVLRNELNYEGIIITDALNMGAIHKNFTTKEALILAVNAGNDMICVSLDGTDVDVKADEYGNYETVTYATFIDDVVDAVYNNQIEESTIDNAVKRIIAWKYYKGLINE